MNPFRLRPSGTVAAALAAVLATPTCPAARADEPAPALPTPPPATAEQTVSNEELRLSELLRRGATMEEVAQARGTLPVKTPQEALRLLKVGNARFFSNNSRQGNLSAQERRAQILGQSPFAVILGCSDSRVPTEIVFDQTLGDLFAVRVAGNICESATTASVEYAIEHLKAKLVVVLGHEGCGAVKAAMLPAAAVGQEPKPIQELIGHISPAVNGLPPIRDRKSREREAVIANVRLQVYALKQDPLVKAAIAEGKVAVVGGFYEITSGIVDFYETEDDLRVEGRVARAAGLPVPTGAGPLVAKAAAK
jgi:carbonic anhydrase